MMALPPLRIRLRPPLSLNLEIRPFLNSDTLKVPPRLLTLEGEQFSRVPPFAPNSSFYPVSPWNSLQILILFRASPKRGPFTPV